MKTRKAYIVLVIMLAEHFQQSDSTAVITTEGSLREKYDFECGTSVVIICTTQPKPNNVIWTIDHVWVADCTFGVCTENSSNPAFYTFTHNATEGVFHLNIQQVSFQQNGKIFACEEGSGPSDTLTAEVNVLPDISTAIDTTSNSQVVVTTGCVYPVTNVTFEWYIYQVGIEAVLYTKQKPVQTFNDSGCSLGDCGDSDATRVSSTLNIPSVETGDLYFFQVIVKHAATSKVEILNSTIKYRINVDQGDITSDESDYVLLKVLCVTAVSVILVVVIVIFIFCARCRITGFKCTERTNNMIKLQWNVACCCIPTSTILKCSTINQVIDEYRTNATRPLTHHTFSSLTERTIYRFDLEIKTRMCCTAKATLPVETLGSPDPPTEFYIDEEDIKDSSVLLQWKTGYNGGYPQHFMLMYSENVNHDWNSERVEDTNQNYIVHDKNGLTSRTGYYFEVFAANEIGESSTSEQLIVHTKGKPDPPTEFSVIRNRVTQSSIAIQWKPGYDGGYEQVFILMYSKHELDRTSEKSECIEEEWISERIEEGSNKHLKKYTINNLEERTTYNIRIVAENKCGKSSLCSLPQCGTKGKPDPPTELSVIRNRVTQSSIAIQWKPGYDGGYEQVFMVMYSINDRDGTSENSSSEESMEWICEHIGKSSGKDHMVYTIKDLAKRTTYNIMIVAENQYGKSLSQLKCETKG